MQRESYTARITRNGEVIGETTKYAFNSAIRATEALVRELARSEGRMYTGGKASSTGERNHKETYTRPWSSGGAVVTATVEKKATPGIDVTRFEALGRQAYLDDQPAAPALNAEVMAALTDRKVGDRDGRAIMLAFARGYEAEREIALAAILAETV